MNVKNIYIKMIIILIEVVKRLICWGPPVLLHQQACFCYNNFDGWLGAVLGFGLVHNQV